MPSTPQNPSRQGALLLLLCMIGLACPIEVRAGEPASANSSAAYYPPLHKPLQNSAARFPAAARFPSSSENALRHEENTRQTAPLTALIGNPSTNELRKHPPTGPLTVHTANPIGTTDHGRVHGVSHLRPSSEPSRLSDNRTAPQESTPLPESSPSLITRLPPKGESGEEGLNSNGIFPTLLTIGGALLLVIGLFLVFAWMMKRTSTRTGGILPKGVIEVLGHQTITGRHQVHLLRIGKRLLLVSVMPDSVETLTEITDPMEVDQIAGVCHQTGPESSTGTFQTIMRQFSQDTKPIQEPVPTVDQLRQRLG